MRLLVRGIALAFIFAPLLRAQEAPPADARSHAKTAIEAYRQKDYDKMVREMEAALRARPRSQPYLYNLAVGYALSHRVPEAIETLKQAAALGFIYPDLGSDPDFAELRKTKAFDEVSKLFAANARPKIRSQKKFTVPGQSLITEGLAYNPETKTFYLGSVRERKIIAIDAEGNARLFSKEADNLWGVFGMKVDPANRVLWVCTNALPQMAGFRKEDAGRSAICRYDLASGKLLQKYEIPRDGHEHSLGDLTLDAAGNVYASDSITPALYRIPKTNDRLELFLTSDLWLSPQGLFVTLDERHLVMADYLGGLFLIDLTTKKITPLRTPANATTLGLDGIYRAPGGAVAVQNGVTPNRIVHLSFNAGDTAVTKLEVLEANNPLFSEPTLGVVDGNCFFFIANGQWGAYDDAGKPVASFKSQDHVVLEMKLPAE